MGFQLRKRNHDVKREFKVVVEKFYPHLGTRYLESERRAYEDYQFDVVMTRTYRREWLRSVPYIELRCSRSRPGIMHAHKRGRLERYYEARIDGDEREAIHKVVRDLAQGLAADHRVEPHTEAAMFQRVMSGLLLGRSLPPHPTEGMPAPGKGVDSLL